MNYRELKASDRTGFAQQPVSKSFSERLENFPQKIGVKFNNFSKKLRQISDLNQLRFKSKLELIRKLDYAEHDIYIRVTSPAEYKRLYPCRKEPWTVQWLEKFLQPGDTLFDIGANIGGYSLIASKLTAGKVKVFAFEPSFSNFSSLCQNIVLNHCQESITPFQIALSSQTGIVNFNYKALEAGAAFHLLGETAAFEAVYRQPVITYSLDDFITHFNLPTPNHIKLDVDGPELEVLYGAEKAVADSRLRSLMIELNEDTEKSDEKIVDFLASKGLQLHERHLRISPQGIKRPYSFCIFKRENGS